MSQVQGYLVHEGGRRLLGVCGVALCLLAAASQTAFAVAVPRSIAVMNCTLIDDNAAYNDADTNRIQQARIGMISDDLRAQLRDRQLYRVADNGPASGMIAQLASTQDMNACNGCELQVGRKLGVERVGVCWVQKVSNLIININLRVEDVASGQAVFQRSVDIRGNTDLSWQRGVKALVDRLADDPDATR
ncbi:DUF3280 domain-containing protein [Caballeronia mineralivorans]|jgi:hypothetical protein|uniref:DUF3280 domain-containing protein n=1 Tax=Caballeronia mineralivorans TaxID=2010198 RepID=UPI0023F394B6|nr:DUF3280 domain-containing protein [Caballeronia mineralivorans]MDB5784147.1 hypothetical protein [Caballeronia mineralivorans]MEA3096921.1 hypothetical protein [Caballeronia mineralivorans]